MSKEDDLFEVVESAQKELDEAVSASRKSDTFTKLDEAVSASPESDTFTKIIELGKVFNPPSNSGD